MTFAYLASHPVPSPAAASGDSEASMGGPPYGSRELVGMWLGVSQVFPDANIQMCEVGKEMGLSG